MRFMQSTIFFMVLFGVLSASADDGYVLVNSEKLQKVLSKMQQRIVLLEEVVYKDNASSVNNSGVNAIGKKDNAIKLDEDYQNLFQGIEK